MDTAEIQREEVDKLVRALERLRIIGTKHSASSKLEARELRLCFRGPLLEVDSQRVLRERLTLEGNKRRRV